VSGAPFWFWVLIAFGVAAAWGLTVVLNKRTLQYVDPFALNMIMRVPTIVLLAVVASVLTLTGAWDLGFGMTWAAFGYITLSAVVTWLIAFNSYYLVLRLGALGVVTPIMATDPLFTAVFAVILLGSGLGKLVIVGLVVSTAGVVLLSHWTETSSTPTVEPPVGGDGVPATGLESQATRIGGGALTAPPETVSAASAGPGTTAASAAGAGPGAAAASAATGATGGGAAGADPGGGGTAPRSLRGRDTPAVIASATVGKSAARLRAEVIGLALVAAAGWGLGPVVIEMATRSVGGASVTMMLQSQTMGLLMLLPIVWRRHRIAVRRLLRSERRLVIRLVLTTSVLEMIFAVSYYVLIDEIGAVLTVLIIASSPVFAILGGMWLLGERYGWKLAIGAVVTLAGVAIATLQGM
jgi:drug/metabolite transporter (DMT)-like permease